MDLRQVAIVGFFRDSTVRMWRAPYAEWKKTANTTLANASLTIAPNMSLIAAYEMDTIDVFDAKTGKTIKSMQFEDQKVESLAFTTDGQFLVAVVSPFIIKVWETASFECQGDKNLSEEIADRYAGPLQILTGSVQSGITISRNSSNYCVVWKQPWDLSEPCHRIGEFNEAATSLVGYSDDGEVAILNRSSDKATLIVDLRSGKVRCRFANTVEMGCIDPTQCIFCGIYSGGHVCLWDIHTRKRLCDFWTVENPLSACWNSPDILVIVSSQGEIQLWDISPVIGTQTASAATNLASTSARAPILREIRFAQSAHKHLPSLASGCAPPLERGGMNTGRKLTKTQVATDSKLGGTKQTRPKFKVCSIA